MNDVKQMADANLIIVGAGSEGWRRCGAADRPGHRGLGYADDAAPKPKAAGITIRKKAADLVAEEQRYSRVGLACELATKKPWAWSSSIALTADSRSQAAARTCKHAGCEQLDSPAQTSADALVARVFPDVAGSPRRFEARERHIQVDEGDSCLKSSGSSSFNRTFPATT